MSANPPGADQRNDSSGSGNRPRPSLQPTSASTLIVAVLGAAAVGWIWIARDYGAFPTLTWLPTIILGGLGALEIGVSVATKARIDRRPGTTPVDPLVVVRYVVLSKASSIVGALFSGFFGAIMIWLIAEQGRLAAAANDLPPAIGGFGGSAALLVGALLLERACRVPPRPDDDDDDEDETPPL